MKAVNRHPQISPNSRKLHLVTPGKFSHWPSAANSVLSQNAEPWKGETVGEHLLNFHTELGLNTGRNWDYRTI